MKKKMISVLLNCLCLLVGLMPLAATALPAGSGDLNSLDEIHIIHLPSSNEEPCAEESASSKPVVPNEPEDPSDVLFLDKDLQAASIRAYSSYSANELIAHLRAQLSYGQDAMKTQMLNPFNSLLSPDVAREFFLAKTDWSTQSEVYQEYRDIYQRNHSNEGLDFEGRLKQIFGDENFGMPKDQASARKYFLKRDLSYLTQRNIDAVYQAAKRIIAGTKENDNIVIFGNTPYFVGRAIQRILELNPSIKRNIIEIAFSGTPNLVRENNFPDPKDAMTQENLEHFKKRLRRHGLMACSPKLFEHDTYIVDVIGSGGGPAFMIKTILRDVKDKEEILTQQGIKGLPKLKIIALNEFTFAGNDGRHRSIASHSAKDGEPLTLSFPNKDEPQFEVPAQVVHMPGHRDFDDLVENIPSLRMVTRYNAAYWRDELDKQILEAEPTYTQRFLATHFDTNILDRIQKEGTREAASANPLQLPTSKDSIQRLDETLRAEYAKLFFFDGDKAAASELNRLKQRATDRQVASFVRQIKKDNDLGLLTVNGENLENRNYQRSLHKVITKGAYPFVKVKGSKALGFLKSLLQSKEGPTSDSLGQCVIIEDCDAMSLQQNRISEIFPANRAIYGDHTQPGVFWVLLYHPGLTEIGCKTIDISKPECLKEWIQSPMINGNTSLQTIILRVNLLSDNTFHYSILEDGPEVDERLKPICETVTAVSERSKIKCLIMACIGLDLACPFRADLSKKRAMLLRGLAEEIRHNVTFSSVDTMTAAQKDFCNLYKDDILLIHFNRNED